MSEDASQKSAAANNENCARSALPKTVGEKDETLVQADFTPTSSYNSQAHAPEDALNVEDARVESQRKDSAWVSSTRPEFAHSNFAHPEAAIPETDFSETAYRGYADDASSGQRPATGADPSRKVETPDMLRWRAEMLLDEMMVGAVDASAGDGAPVNWRTASLATDPPLPLDDRPRKVQITTPASSVSAAQADARASDAADGHAADGHAGNGYGSNGHDAASATNGHAGVRAALPKPARPRTPTVLPGSGVSSSGVSGSGATSDRVAHDGAGNTGAAPNGTAHSEGGATGYTTALDAVDDGRPTLGSRLYTPASGVDASASDTTTPATAGNGIAARAASWQPPSAASATRSAGKLPQRLDGRQTNAAGYASQYDLQPDIETRTQAAQPATDWRAPQPAPSVDPLEGPSNWEQITPRTPAATSQQPSSPTVNPITGRAPTRTNGAAANDASGKRAPAGKKLVAVEQRYPKAIPSSQAGKRGNPAAGAHNDQSATQDDTWEFGLGPVRLNPAVVNGSSITGAMAVNRASSRYASLLPRATPWDLHEMEREIVSLQEEMGRVLPSGHESSRRARHLLEKAHTIFASDPMRSAEVDYYLTQVRSIVQRSRQTMQWSNLYRHHLNRYHLTWIVLSLLMLALGIFYGERVTNWATLLFGWRADGLSAAFVAPALISMFAGSLGGSIGALFTIRRYHQKDMGFFDRKYSLRGLVLPLIGFVGGISLFAVFVALYWAVGTTVPLPVLLALLPACAAFLFGLLQENIYGTRD